MTKIGLPLLSLAIAVSSLACEINKEDSKLCTELRANVAAEKAVHAEHQLALKTGIIEALESLPEAGEEDCPAKGLNWQKSTSVPDKSFDVESIPQPVYQGEYRAGSTCGTMNQENVKNMVSELARQSEELKSGYRLHLFESERVGAKLLANNGYEPGSVRGTLLVWSYAEKKFVCAADAYAESGARLHTTKGGVKSSKDLDDHLSGVAVRTAIERLKAITVGTKGE